MTFWRGVDSDPTPDPGEGGGISDGDVRLQGQWTGGSAWATRGATGLLWTALACGPVGLMLGGVAFLTAQPAASAQTQQVSDTASEQAAAEQFAEHFVVTWLTTPRGEEASLAPFIDASGIALPEVPWSVAHPAPAALVDTGDGRWAVTVAVTVTTPPVEGQDPAQAPGPIRRFFTVPVHYDAGALIAEALPAPVAAPATAEPGRLGYRYTLPDQHPASTASAEFLAALLTGAGDVTRYVSPGTQIEAITPAPYAEIRLRNVLVDQNPADLPEEPANGDELHQLVTAEARSAAGQAISVQYSLALTAREGRWEVRSMEPAPWLAADQSASSSTSSSTSQPSSTGPVPAPSPTTDPTTSPGTSPTR
nr:conjugal transfer protein [Modestobacter marinus]